MKYESELYHHGILGQKWGKKNGPPYPLGSSDHSSSEKKAGWRDSLKSATQKVTKVVNNAKNNSNALKNNTSINPKSNPDLTISPNMTPQTKQAINDYNKMSDREFMNKYFISKSAYAKRVQKYGDPNWNNQSSKSETVKRVAGVVAAAAVVGLSCYITGKQRIRNLNLQTESKNFMQAISRAGIERATIQRTEIGRTYVNGILKKGKR